MRKPVLFVALLGAAAALVKRAKAHRGERDVWKTATAPAPKDPDLR